MSQKLQTLYTIHSIYVESTNRLKKHSISLKFRVQDNIIHFHCLNKSKLISINLIDSFNMYSKHFINSIFIPLTAYTVELIFYIYIAHMAFLPFF